mmetsp:Transcript_110906/g.324443  ORF Transcript_110906/g.324443 Transcript_110906/m.324443 type:complete len:340 (+) Transcript_110906:15-1034(+)
MRPFSFALKLVRGGILRPSISATVLILSSSIAGSLTQMAARVGQTAMYQGSSFHDRSRHVANTRAKSAGGVELPAARGHRFQHAAQMLRYANTCHCSRRTRDCVCRKPLPCTYSPEVYRALQAKGGPIWEKGRAGEGGHDSETVDGALPWSSSISRASDTLDRTRLPALDVAAPAAHAVASTGGAADRPEPDAPSTQATINDGGAHASSTPLDRTLLPPGKAVQEPAAKRQVDPVPSAATSSPAAQDPACTAVEAHLPADAPHRETASAKAEQTGTTASTQLTVQQASVPEVSPAATAPAAIATILAKATANAAAAGQAAKTTSKDATPVLAPTASVGG